MRTGEGGAAAVREAGGTPKFTGALLLAVLGPAVSFTVTAVDPLMLSLNLPLIGRTFGVPPDVLGFLGGAATLVVASAVLAVGNLGDAHGPKRLLVAGLAAGILVNLLSTLSHNYPFLLAMRLLDGLAMAAMLGLSLALLTVSVPSGSRPLALGVFMAVDMGLYGVTPLVGGAVVDWLGWRGVFLPAALLSLVALVLTVRHVAVPPGHRVSRLDVAGVTLFGLALLAFVHGIGAAQNGLGHPQAWIPLTVSALTAAAFVRHERRTPEPAMPLELFRSRPFAVAVLAALTLNFLSAGFSVVLGQFGSSVLALSTQEIGLLYLPGTAVIVAAGICTGRVMAAHSPRPVMLTGLAVLIASSLLTAATAETRMALWLLVLATWSCNLGTLITSASASESILSHTPPGKAGTTAAVQPAFGMTGYALGPTVYLLLLGLFFERRWTADAEARGISLSQAGEAVDTVRGAMATSPGTAGYDPNLLRQASGLDLALDFTNGLRLTMLTVSAAPLLVLVAAYKVMPRRSGRAPRSEGGARRGDGHAPRSDQ
ncbi:MFS transporter [Streptomyces sp. NPDC014864]|uniref:MFS transporter n=1 Tax=Streptomyces sp. NPDC014864 TaxID=3364924 RepID=UPI0036FE4729